MSKRPFTVVFVGRPNVGKSTLFNRFTGTRRAIVTPIPGTTRDVISQMVAWQGVTMQLVDTGGLFGASQDPLHELVVVHGQRAIARADVIVFIVDGRDGLVAGDEEIAAVVRARNVPVLLAVNKTDDRRARDGAFEFYRMGFEPVFEVAAEHGVGTGDLLDALVGLAREAGTAGAGGRVGGGAEGELDGRGGEPDETDADQRDAEAAEAAEAEETSETAVAIIGRPNVGKSSLVNRLLREELMIVSELPGTTRDAVDAVLKWHRRQFRIVDTAGIRRPGRVARAGTVESVSVRLAERAVERADVAVLVIDASVGVTDQDGTVAGVAQKAGCGIVVAANKWDLTKGEGQDFAKRFDEQLRFQLKFLEFAPIVHISALTGERTGKLLEVIDRVATARRTRVPTGELNRFVDALTRAHPPVSPGKKAVRILYAAQVSAAPPTFVFFTNVATTFHFSYERFLANQIREAFGFEGTPIRVQVRSRGRERERDEREADAGKRASKAAPRAATLPKRQPTPGSVASGAGPSPRAAKPGGERRAAAREPARPASNAEARARSEAGGGGSSRTTSPRPSSRRSRGRTR